MDKLNVQEKLSQAIAKILTGEFLTGLFPRLALTSESGEPGKITLHLTEAGTNSHVEITVSVKVK